MNPALSDPNLFFIHPFLVKMVLFCQWVGTLKSWGMEEALSSWVCCSLCPWQDHSISLNSLPFCKVGKFLWETSKVVSILSDSKVFTSCLKILPLLTQKRPFSSFYMCLYSTFKNKDLSHIHLNLPRDQHAFSGKDQIAHIQALQATQCLYSVSTAATDSA